MVPHPFTASLKLWCQLQIEFNGVFLLFSTPHELDQFIDVMSQNPLPSGHRLVKGRRSLGRPNTHWLSRLPAKAKAGKFRKQVIAFLEDNKACKEFREFYVGKTLNFEAPGLYQSYFEALQAKG